MSAIGALTDQAQRRIRGGLRSYGKRTTIAGMLHSRDLTGIIEVDGLNYEWTLQREPQWCTADGWRGMVVTVRQVGEQREALLEFPMPKSGNGSQYRRRPQVSNAIAANGVRAALAAGWEPASRGKPETYMVDANGC